VKAVAGAVAGVVAVAAEDAVVADNAGEK